MPAAHARVEALELLRRLRPPVKRAGGGSPLTVLAFDEAEIFPRASRQRAGLSHVLFRFELCVLRVLCG